MKKLFSFLFIAGIFTSCNETIHGDGHVITESRTISSAEKIKVSGSFDVEIEQGNSPSLTIEADGNLLPYIITKNEDGWLRVRTKDDFSISSSHKIKISIITDKLENISVSGSNSVVGKNKFTEGDKLSINISGNGDVTLDVNTPKVYASISGNGNVVLSGETKDEEIHVSGSGDYKCENLKAENAEVHVSGVGNVKVYADNKLDVHVSGSGDVFYKGNPQITQSVSGAGSVKKLE
jgi:hypothetical protein